MILRDVTGTLIFPGQIHGLAVVDARHTPALYPRPDGAAYAVVVEGQQLDQQADGTSFMGETRYVLAWFELECIAEAVLEELIAAQSPSAGQLKQIFEGEVIL